ncbi:MAG: hypothetical protein ACYCS1_09315 [Gammaproteobacteria bacterium]
MKYFYLVVLIGLSLWLTSALSAQRKYLLDFQSITSINSFAPAGFLMGQPTRVYWFSGRRGSTSQVHFYKVGHFRAKPSVINIDIGIARDVLRRFNKVSFSPNGKCFIFDENLHSTVYLYSLRARTMYELPLRREYWSWAWMSNHSILLSRGSTIDSFNLINHAGHVIFVAPPRRGGAYLDQYSIMKHQVFYETGGGPNPFRLYTGHIESHHLVRVRKVALPQDILVNHIDAISANGAYIAFGGISRKKYWFATHRPHPQIYIENVVTGNNVPIEAPAHEKLVRVLGLSTHGRWILANFCSSASSYITANCQNHSMLEVAQVPAGLFTVLDQCAKRIKTSYKKPGLSVSRPKRSRWVEILSIL